MSDKALEARELSFAFEPGHPVLEQVSFALMAGELLAVLGPNGSGKSTLLRILSRVLKPGSGQVMVLSRPLESFSRKELAQKIAVIPQSSVIEFPYRVLEVVLMGRSPYLGRFQLEGKRDLEIARQALLMTDCLELAERGMEEISGGERQRVILARGLAQEPEILLADEPFTHLDLHHQVRFLGLLSALRKARSISVLFTTHDLNLAGIFADRILLLEGGKVAALGTPEQVLDPELVSRIYRVRLKLVPQIFEKRPLLVPQLDKEMTELKNYATSSTGRKPLQANRDLTNK
jgi:iron complex transport system ATP-binding protein